MPFCPNCGASINQSSQYCPSCGKALSSSTSSSSTYRPSLGQPQQQSIANSQANQSIYSNVQYATIVDRFAAQLVDWILLAIVATIISVPFGFFWWASGSFAFSPFYWLYSASTWIGWILIPLGYFTYFESTSGQTIGKRILSIKVVSETNRGNIDLGSSLVRNLLRIIDFLPVFYLIGFIVIETSSKRQRIGDLGARSIVVKISK